MKIYEGRRVDGLPIVEVTTQGEKEPLTPGKSLKLRVYSQGFEWGYAGAGPSQLSLAILLHAYPERGEAWASDWHLKFQAAVVQKLPHEAWRLTGAQIARAVESLEEAWKPGKFDREAPTASARAKPIGIDPSPSTVEKAIDGGALADLPIGLRIACQELASRVWRERLDPSIRTWARELAEDSDGSPLSVSIRLSMALREATRGRGPVDDDDFARSFGSACLSLGIRVKLLIVHKGNLSTVFVAVLVSSTPDKEEPWFSKDTWWAFDVSGATAWPKDAVTIDPLFRENGP